MHETEDNGFERLRLPEDVGYKKNVNGIREFATYLLVRDAIFFRFDGKKNGRHFFVQFRITSSWSRKRKRRSRRIVRDDEFYEKCAEKLRNKAHKLIIEAHESMENY